MSATFHLVRHGQTDWNYDHRLQGQTDIPLNAAGVAQANAAALQLSRQPIALVFTSDLSRARDTAAAIAAIHDLPLHVDSALRERGFGLVEGRLDSELMIEYGAALTDYWTQPDLAFPGGETRRQVYDRVSAVLDPLIENPPQGDVVVVSHGGTIRVALEYLRHGRLAPERAGTRELIENGSVHSVTV